MLNNFKKKVLKNGMTVLFEKRNLPIVSVAFAVRAGGVHEEVSEKGISHFIEHMLYKGTKKRNSKQIAEAIEKSGGHLNGFTSEEVVAYWCKMPSEKLDVALDVLGDMVKNPKFDEAELEKERKVIFEEIKLHKDNPSRHVFEGIQSELYTGTKGMNLAGTFETMNLVDRKKIAKKFEELYKTNNLILCVVGNVDFKDVVDFANRNFPEERGEVFIKDFDLKNESRVERRSGIDQANLVFAYHVPISEDSRNYSARVLNSLMTEGFSSRLFEEIREKRNLAYAIDGGSEIGKSYAYNYIYVGTMKENVEKVRKIILKEFGAIAEGLKEKELREIKSQLISQYKISMEDSQTQMVNLLFSEIHGSAEEFYKFEELVNKVRLKDVKDLARKVFNGGYSFFALIPE